MGAGTETGRAHKEKEEQAAVEVPAKSGLLSRRDLLRYGAVGAVAALGLMGKEGTVPQGGDARPRTSVRKSFSVSRPITLTYWIWAGASVHQAGFNAVKKAFGKDFGNVDLKIVTFSGGDQGVAEKLGLALSAHSTLPTVVELNYIEVPQFAQKGVLTNLGHTFGPVEASLFQGAKEIAQYQHQYVDFPFELKGKMFFYREDLFESAGIDLGAIPTMTKADFIAMGKQFTAKHPGKYIMNMANEPQEYLFDEILSAYAPISFADSSGKYDITTNPAFADTLSFMREIRTSGIAYPLDDFTTDWPAAIKAEKICGFLIAEWMDEFLPEYATLSAYGKWKVLPWPTMAPLKDQRYGSDAGGSVLVVPVGSPNASLAVELLTKWHLQETGVLASFEASGILPYLESAVAPVVGSLASAKKPASMSKADWMSLPQNYFGGKPYLETKLACTNHVKVFGFDPKALVDYETVMVDWMYKAVQGKASVSAALAGMQKDMQNQVGNPWSES